MQAGLAVEFKVVGGLVAASRPESTSGGQDNYFALGTESWKQCTVSEVVGN